MYENEKIDWKRQVPTGKAQVFIHQLTFTSDTEEKNRKGHHMRMTK